MLVGKALNGNVMCTVYIKTTGKDPDEDQIYNICILPLDLNFKPLYGWMFDKFVQVKKKVHEADRAFARKPSDVWDQFDLWFEEVIKKGQIIPIGHDWPVTSRFLRNFFSDAGMQIYFHEDVRDIRVIANYLNDQYESNDQPIPFGKRRFRYILSTCDCKLENRFTAAQAAIQLADTYRSLVRLSF